MSRSLPPLTWFRAFDATARHLSFTRAAGELGFTQSAISQHIRALEQRLGTQLFLRGSRGLSLTDAGRRLVPDVAVAMARLTAATEAIIPASEQPQLTIATSASVAQWLLVPKMAEFRSAHPEIGIRIITTVWPEDFLATSADIEIRFGRKEVVGKGAKLVGPSTLCAVASPQLLENMPDPLDWDFLQQQTLIQPVGISALWTQIQRKLGIPSPNEPQLYVDTHGLAVDLAVSGAGIALTHNLIASLPVSDGKLVRLPLPETPSSEGYYLARNPTNASEHQDTFQSWFDDLVESLAA